MFDPLRRLSLLLGVLLIAPPLGASDGLPDPTFGPGNNGRIRVAFDLGGTLADYAQGIAVDALDRIVLCGQAFNGANYDFAVARLTRDGALDATFDGDGRLTWDRGTNDDDFCSDITLGPDGTTPWLTGKTGDSIYISAVPPNPIVEWGPFNPVTPPRIVAQSDGKLVVAYSDADGLGDFVVTRWSPSPLTLDPQFGNNGIATIAFDLGGSEKDFLYDLALQPDGKILLVGAAEWGGGDFDFAIARLLPNGAPDTGFGPYSTGRTFFGFDLDLTQPDEARAVAIAENGTIYVVGSAGTNTGRDAGIIALGADGYLLAQTHFALGLNPTTRVTAAVVQDDGKLVVAGRTTQLSSEDDNWHYRLLPTLAIDQGFLGPVVELDPGIGGGDWPVGIALQGGKPVIGGTAEWASPDFDFAAMRLENALIFADGFTRGSTGHWSLTAP